MNIRMSRKWKRMFIWGLGVIAGLIQDPVGYADEWYFRAAFYLVTGALLYFIVILVDELKDIEDESNHEEG